MKRRRVAGIIRTAAVVVAVLGVFWVPWHCGGDAPVPGESYALGFNNRVGILALAVAIALATGGRLCAGERTTALEWFSVRPRLLPARSEAGLEYAVLVLASCLWAAVLWWWGSSLVDPAWAEARGFHHGLDLLALGKVPYRDFMFNYGPATLYGPYALTLATQGDLSFERAYLVTLVLFTVLGWWFLFALLRALEFTTRQRAGVLALSLAPWAMITMGLHYTPLRFFVVPGSLVLLDAAIRSRPEGGSRTAAVCRAALAAGAAAFTCLAVSPEMGIAGVAGIVAAALPLWLAGTRSVATAVVVGCLGVVGLTVLGLPDYFLSVAAFASGGSNFPIYPNAHNVVLVVMALVVLPRVIAAALVHPADSRAPLALGLAVGGGMTLPAALGRCDPGHVVINTTVLAALMFAAARAGGRRALVAWSLVYAIVFVVLYHYSYWSHYVHNYMVAAQMRRAYADNPATVAAWRDGWDRLRRERPQGPALHWSSVLPFPQELSQLTDQGHVALVCGNEGNLFLARYLVLQPDPPPDYFHAYSQGAVTPAEIDRKVRESLASRFLLVPGGVMATLQGDIDLAAYQRGVQEFLSRLLLFPVRSTARREPYLPEAAIARRLLEHFEPIGQYEGYVILKNKTTPSRETGPPATD